MTDPKMDVSMHVVPKEEGFGNLYRKLKPIIWVLRLLGLEENANEAKDYVKDVKVSHFTGFTVSKDGLVMTCAHTLCMFDLRKTLILGRRLDEAGFEYTLKVEKIQESWDVVLLKAYKECEGELDGSEGGSSNYESGLNDCKHGEFAQDGSLEKGETVMMIGHPGNLIGSCLLGSVAYKCVKNVLPPTDFNTCKDFEYGCENTPGYRMLGHIWNCDYYRKWPDDSVSQCHPNIPIIQCNELGGSPGTSGGPIFNTRGEIVGMGIMGVRGFDVGVHVTLLRHFFEMYKVS